MFTMAEMNQYVSFILSDERYAIDIMSVEEIIKLIEVTPVPKAPDFVGGIINMRGKVIPVVDLKNRLNLGESEETPETRIMITAIKDKTVGFIVDAVEEVLRIEPDLVEKAPGVATSIDSNYIRGVARTDKGLIIILNVNKLFSSYEEDQLMGF